MGLDVTICVRAKVPALELCLPDGYSLMVAADYDMQGATHRVDTLARYYGRGYERGDWPTICAVLMKLHAHKDVETVWYGSDCDDSPPMCTPETVLAISAHYMAHGHRPYRDQAYNDEIKPRA